MTPDEVLASACAEHGLQNENGLIDLGTLPFEDALFFLRTLTRSGRFVLHGTSADERYPFLEARQANDAAKESGNKKAVYATTDPWSALGRALFSASYARSRFRSRVWGESGSTERPSFKFSPNLYGLFVAGDPSIFAGGYVYLLDRAEFVSADDAGGIEWHAEENRVPIAACRVPAGFGPHVFSLEPGKETVFAYSPEELESIEAFVKERFPDSDSLR